MINLIPNEEKKKMVRGFYYRAATVFLFALSITMLIASITLLPSYFFSREKKSLNSKKLDTQAAQVGSLKDQEVFAAVSNLDRELTLIEKAGKNKFLPSERVIKAIILRKVKDVKITQFSFNESREEMKVGINGTASSRETLLLFRQALENDPSFKKVDLPISNFIKGSNIKFYLSLIPA